MCDKSMYASNLHEYNEFAWSHDGSIIVEELQQTSESLHGEAVAK